MYICVRGEMGKTNDGKEKRCGRRKSGDLGQRSRQNEGRGTRMAGHSVNFIVTIQVLLQFSACCI